MHGCGERPQSPLVCRSSADLTAWPETCTGSARQRGQRHAAQVSEGHKELASHGSRAHEGGRQCSQAGQCAGPQQPAAEDASPATGQLAKEQAAQPGAHLARVCSLGGGDGVVARVHERHQLQEDLHRQALGQRGEHLEQVDPPAIGCSGRLLTCLRFLLTLLQPFLVVHLASQGPADSTGSTMQPPVTTPLSAELPSRGDAVQLASRKAQLRMRGATGPLHAAGRSALGTHLSCWCCCQAEKAATSAESESISSRSAPEAYCRAGTAQSSGTHIALYRAAVHACRATPAPGALSNRCGCTEEPGFWALHPVRTSMGGSVKALHVSLLSGPQVHSQAEAAPEP